jgi:CheY-like chemotaxis protein
MAEEAANSLRGNTALVIEDSPTQSLHLQLLLEQEGLGVLIANDGEAGLDLAQKHEPDIIILDLQMPGINGFQVCERLKGSPQTADIPVILLTRHDDQEAVSQGLRLGAVDFIPKDAFADVVLLETLRQMGLIREQNDDF